MNRPIISAAELADRLAKNEPIVLLDARAGEGAFRDGHLRGAHRADLETQLSAARDAGADPARGGRHPLPPIERWSAQLGAWGIGPQTAVVVYDDQNGANAAARAWWMLRSVGHDAVSVLDGGFAAAVAVGIPVTTHAHPFEATSDYPARAWGRPVVDVARVNVLRNDPEWKVLDVRATPRFRGETEPIDPIAGHIPGAVNLPFAENLENGVFKSPEALRDLYEPFLGGTPVERLVVHCGSGVTACHTLLALESAGLDGASLYVGSWGEWCRNDLPREP
jgi:thiosulfate/3-mercaptopyruvate sulfurtransferase